MKDDVVVVEKIDGRRRMTQRLESASLAARVTTRRVAETAGRHNINTAGFTSTQTMLRFSRGCVGRLIRSTTSLNHRTMAAFSVKSIDHVVLTAKDVQKTIEFYTTRLGMKHEVFKSDGVERHALSFGKQKLNLHQSGKEFEPKAGHVQPGSEDLCFITDHPIDDVLKSWQSNGIEVRCLPVFRVEQLILRSSYRSWKAAR